MLPLPSETEREGVSMRRAVAQGKNSTPERRSMSLKFQQVTWDERHLMYVEFTADGQKMRWYPKWKEVDDILHCAWLTEGAYNKSRWKNYFDSMASEIIIRDLLRRIVPGGRFSPLPKLDTTISQFFRDLRTLSLYEVQDAKKKDD